MKNKVNSKAVLENPVLDDNRVDYNFGTRGIVPADDTDGKRTQVVFQVSH